MIDRPVRRRPFGVTMIIGMQIMSVLAAGIGLLAEYAVVATDLHVEGGQFDLGVVISLALEFGLSVASIYGLWRMRRWGWFVTMLDLGISLGIGIYQYFYIAPSYVEMLLNVIMVFYLNQREVQSAFVRRQSQGRTT